MALASGADVKIGTREFMLTSDEDSYTHMYESLYADQQNILGTDSKTANPGINLWAYDNWIAGDGLKFYDQDQPARYWTGNVNPRGLPGAITSPPDIANSTVTNGASVGTQGYFTVVGGRLWYFRGRQGWSSTTGAGAWTENTQVDDASFADTGYSITAVTNNGEYPIVTAHNGTNRRVFACDSTITCDTVVSSVAGPKFFGMAVRDQFLYGWTGGAVMRYDHTSDWATTAITHSSAYRVARHRSETPLITLDAANIVAGDNSVFYFRTSDSESTVFELKFDTNTNVLVPKTVWVPPLGFSISEICVSMGILYLFGKTHDRICLWGMSLATRQPLFLGYVGESVTDSNDASGRILGADGANVFMSLTGINDDAYVYMYDAEQDAFSELDHIDTSQAFGALASFKSFRIMGAWDSPGTGNTIYRWLNDRETPTRSWSWDSSAFDMGYPQDEKVLLGFHVVQDPAIASGTCNVDYQLNEDGVWIDAGTTAGGSNHTYIQVSDGTTTRKFRTLRVRMNGTSGCRVFSITTRYYVNTKQEVWKLKLDLRNEPGTTRRPSNRTLKASTLRDYLHTIVAAGNVVTFQDGRRYKEKSGTADVGFKSHTVLVEFPKDSIDTQTEGFCEVILRSVSPSA